MGKTSWEAPAPQKKISRKNQDQPFILRENFFLNKKLVKIFLQPTSIRCSEAM